MSVEQIEDDTHHTIMDGVPTRAIHPVHLRVRDLHPKRHQSRESHLIPKGEELDARGAGQMHAWFAYVW